MLYVEPNNLVFSKTYNAEFDAIRITFTDQIVRLLQIEDKVNLICLLINRNDTLFYRTKNQKMQTVSCCYILLRYCHGIAS